MFPIIICSHNRPNLLKQTITSCINNCTINPQIIICDDSDGYYFDQIKDIISAINYSNLILYRFKTKVSIGQAKMKGADLCFPSKYIYFADCDMYYLPNWNEPLIEALEKYNDLCIVGGRGVHSFDTPRELSNSYKVGITILQTGYSMLMRRKEFDEFGWFPNEDHDSWIGWEMKSNLNKKIGVITPPVLIHCGLNSQNTIKAHDYENILMDKEKYPELIYE